MFEMPNAVNASAMSFSFAAAIDSSSLPMLLAAPTDVVALNFFFDTLLFCGAILLLANSIDKMKNKVGTLLIANRKIAGLTPSDGTPWHKG